MSNQGHKSCFGACLVGVLVWLCIFQACGQYRFGKEKIIGLSVLAFGAAMDGAVEGYEFDGRLSFERKFGAAKTGFWGSESWRRVYRNGQPEQGFKSGFAKWSGAFDFYHVADDSRKVGYVGGGIVFGIGSAKNKKRHHWVYDTAIIVVTTSVLKSAAMNWVRK